MKQLTQKLPHIARIGLGLLFFVFGLNGFLNFLPMPPMEEGPATAFLGALAATGYMFPLIKATETLGGALLLGNRYVPLALTILAPVIVNIAAFQLILGPASYPMLAAIVGAELFLAWAYREHFRGLLAGKAKAADLVDARAEGLPAATVGA